MQPSQIALKLFLVLPNESALQILWLFYIESNHIYNLAMSKQNYASYLNSPILNICLVEKSHQQTITSRSHWGYLLRKPLLKKSLSIKNPHTTTVKFVILLLSSIVICCSVTFKYTYLLEKVFVCNRLFKSN